MRGDGIRDIRLTTNSLLPISHPKLQSGSAETLVMYGPNAGAAVAGLTPSKCVSCFPTGSLGPRALSALCQHGVSLQVMLITESMGALRV